MGFLFIRDFHRDFGPRDTETHEAGPTFGFVLPWGEQCEQMAAPTNIGKIRTFCPWIKNDLRRQSKGQSKETNRLVVQCSWREACGTPCFVYIIFLWFLLLLLLSLLLLLLRSFKFHVILSPLPPVLSFLYTLFPFPCLPFLRLSSIASLLYPLLSFFLRFFLSSSFVICLLFPFLWFLI